MSDKARQIALLTTCLTSAKQLRDKATIKRITRLINQLKRNQ